MHDQYDQVTPPPVNWLTPREIRETASKRMWRKRAATAVALAVVAGASGYTMSHRDAAPTPADSCIAVVPSPTAAQTWVRVVLLVDKKQPALGTKLVKDLNDRRVNNFGILAVSAESADAPSKGVATISYGNGELDTAWVMQAYLGNSAELVYDDSNDATVKVAVGPQFKTFAANDEMTLTLVEMGNPPVVVPDCDNHQS